MIAEHEVQTTESWGPDALEDAREAGRKQQDSIANQRDQWIRSNRYFYDRIRKALQFIIEPGKRVLELRCETGHMLASVKPSHGVGVEIGDEMVVCARKEHPELYFVKSDLETLELNETFDYIIFNHIFDTVDILRALERVEGAFDARHAAVDHQLQLRVAAGAGTGEQDRIAVEAGRAELGERERHSRIFEACGIPAGAKAAIDSVSEVAAFVLELLQRFSGAAARFAATLPDAGHGGSTDIGAEARRRCDGVGDRALPERSTETFNRRWNECRQWDARQKSFSATTSLPTGPRTKCGGCRRCIRKRISAC